MTEVGKISAADVLRPPILTINGINYRSSIFLKNEIADEKLYRMKDLEEACDPCEDEFCHMEDFNVEYSDGFRAAMKIPSVFHRFIIGPRGEARRKIEVETGVKVILPPKGQEGEVVVKGKEMKNVSSACTRISLIVENEKKKMPFTHFLSFSVVSEETIKGFGDFKEQVLKDCKASGIDDSIFQNSKKLHLTLGVLVLVDDKDKKKMEEVLMDCKQNLIGMGIFDSPMDVKMSGLEYMNDDPSSVDVLYAKVELEDGSDRLQVVADHFVQAFVSSGLMKQQFDRVKLHVTVMNTLFRKGQESEVNHHNKSRERFDATKILKSFKGYTFGTIHLKGLHVSRLHSVNPQGYYESDAYIEF